MATPKKKSGPHHAPKSEMQLAAPAFDADTLARNPDEAIKVAGATFTTSLQYLGAVLGDKNLKPDVASRIHDATSEYSTELEKFDRLARARVVDFVSKHGKRISDAGSMELDLGNGMVQPMLVQKSGHDPKKVEAMLRAKNLSVDDYMDIEVKYKYSEGKAAVLVASKKITADELETCRYETTYRVTKSKPVKDA